MPLYTDNAAGYLSEPELKHLAANYAGEVTMVDHWFGFFMNKVKLLGLDKNSVIIVISDHGLALGDKNYTGKLPYGLMPCLLDLVLFIRHPEGTGAGQAQDAFVQNHDLLPTACNLMGVDVPEWAEGSDIWPVVEGKKAGVRDHASSIFKDYVWVRNEDYALTMKTDKSDLALYDIKEDPQYLNDIAEGNSDIIAQLQDLLRKDAGGEVPVFDAPFPFFDKK
jgi:arylsulfatase A-like enzyme